MSKRNGIILGALGLLVMGLPSVFWLASAADPAVTVHSIGKDVLLEKDSDLLKGLVPARTTIAHLFSNHLIQNSDAQIRRVFNGYLADARLDVPAFAEPAPAAAQTAFVSKPTALGLAEK